MKERAKGVKAFADLGEPFTWGRNALVEAHKALRKTENAFEECADAFGKHLNASEEYVNALMRKANACEWAYQCVRTRFVWLWGAGEEFRLGGSTAVKMFGGRDCVEDKGRGLFKAQSVVEFWRADACRDKD